MSTDKSQPAHESDRDDVLSIEELSAKPVDAKSADLARGGEGSRVEHSDIVVTKLIDKSSPKLS